MSMYVTVKQFPTTRQPKFNHFEPTKKNQRRLIIVKHYAGISKLRAVLLLKYFILFNNVFILGITFLVAYMYLTLEEHLLERLPAS